MSSKKSLVIFFNCHGKEIYKILNKYQPFTNEYDLSYIPLHNHFENDISNIQKELIKTSPSDDILIPLIKELIDIGIYPNTNNINNIVKKHGPYWFLVPGLKIDNDIGRNMITYSA